MTPGELAAILGDLGNLAIPAVLLLIAREWHRIDKSIARLGDAIERLSERVEDLEEHVHGPSPRRR